jgi:hypothetical protein
LASIAPPVNLIGGFVNAGDNLPGVYKPLAAMTLVSTTKIALM